MPTGEHNFSASYDSTVKVITAVVIGILVFVFIAIRSALAGGVGLAVIILPYLYSPGGYAISERLLIVRRLIGDVRIPLDNLGEVRTASADDFRGCMRLWGNGGLFGYYGLFSTTVLGRSTWYMTNRANAVIVRTAGKTVLVSPDDVDAFIAAVRRVAPVPVGTLAPVAGNTGSRKSGVPIGAWIGGGIAILVVAFIVFAMMYSPGPPRLTLTSHSLTIHDRFYSVTVNAADVEVAGIRVVDIKTDPEWRPTARTNGFANAHYRSGWFRVSSGKTVRMYWADGTNLVLLPPKGNSAPVLVQASDADRLVALLHQDWAGR